MDNRFCERWVMTKPLRRSIVALVALVVTSACGNQPMPTMTAPSAVINVVGSLSVTPTTVVVNTPVNVTWSSSSAVRIDACNASSQCVAIATSGTSTSHTPNIRGEWKYKLLNVVAAPDVTIPVAEAIVNVVQ